VLEFSSDNYLWYVSSFAVEEEKIDEKIETESIEPSFLDDQSSSKSLKRKVDISINVGEETRDRVSAMVSGTVLDVLFEFVTIFTHQKMIETFKLQEETFIGQWSALKGILEKVKKVKKPEKKNEEKKEMGVQGIERWLFGPQTVDELKEHIFLHNFAINL
jgi:hypothetical protein